MGFSTCHLLISGTPFTLKIQRYHRTSIGIWMPYFLSGHSKLARQITLLMAFCDYMGNCMKDVVSAPRPNSLHVRRVTAIEDEKENALEYGLSSSHTLNTVCFSGFLVHYFLSYTQNEDLYTQLAGLAVISLLVGLIVLGRIYLGMHSLIDIIGGLAIGLAILAFWIFAHSYIDSFIVSGQNVASFWTALAFLFQWRCIGNCNWSPANISSVSQ